MTYPSIPVPFGDSMTIGIVTLGAPDAANNPDHVVRGLERLSKLGAKTKFGAYALSHGEFLAASPKDLADDLHRMIQDPEVNWIITTGGGANSNALIPFLDPAILKDSPKPIVGLSNTSIILNVLAFKANVVTFHGPVLVWNFGSIEGIDEYTARHFEQAIAFEKSFEIQPEASWRWCRAGTASGRCWGGNLWSFAQLLGTPSLPDLNGAILFLEECFTELHNVEAMLNHCKQAGVFNQLAGMIVGIPVGCEESEFENSRAFDEIVTDVVSEYSFPILVGVNLGHTDRKITIPIGARANLDSYGNRLAFTVDHA